MVKTVVFALTIALVVRTILFQPYTIPSESEEPNLYKGDYIIVSKWTYGYSHHSMVFSPPLFSGRLFFSAPKRGDVVVFKLPRSGHEDYIKRLVGLPGDRIQMKAGHLFINGKPVQTEKVKDVVTNDRQETEGTPGMVEQAQIIRETNPEGRRYLTQVHNPDERAQNTGEYRVPSHCYFMMGDNRGNSADSRFDPGLSPEDPKLGGCGWDSQLDADQGLGVGFVPEENLVGKAQFIMLSWNGNLKLFNPLTWFDFRFSRFFHSLT